VGEEIERLFYLLSQDWNGMFLGEFSHSIDDKGRLTLPAKFREQFASGIVITRGLDGCLFIFTYEDWNEFTSQLRDKLPFTQKSGRDLTRFFFAGASHLIPDRQGRIVIPTFLREYAKLDSTAVITGANTRLEVWEPERWKEMMRDVELNAEQVAEQFSNITF
jgi:MraZ protein